MSGEPVQIAKSSYVEEQNSGSQLSAGANSDIINRRCNSTFQLRPQFFRQYLQLLI